MTQETSAKIITSLVIQKKNKERVNLFLDDEFAFGISLTAALELKKGQRLSPREIEQLQYADLFSKAWNAALRYLGYRARTQQEMEAYLTKKEYPNAVVLATVERLFENGYLDDLEFSRSWLRDRARIRPKGARALRYELRQKGIANDIIETVLQELDENDGAWNALQPKLQRWRALEEREFRQKVTGFLGRRGFGYDAIRHVIERAQEDGLDD